MSEFDNPAEGISTLGPPDFEVAACSGDVEACERALVAGQNINQQFGWHQSTALVLAAKDGHTNVCRLLLERGADFSLTTSGGDTALRLGALYGHVEVCNLLLEHGVPTTGFQACASLQHAASRGHIDICTLFIERGIDPTWVPSDGRSGLNQAAEHGHMEVCLLLAEHGADVNVADYEGETALHKACRAKHLELAKWLTEHMTSEAALQLNKRGESALQSWGIASWQPTSDTVEDEDKEAFRAHVEALFADVL